MIGHDLKPALFYPLYRMGLQYIFYLIFLGGGLPESLQIEDAL